MTRKMKDSGIEWIGEIPGEWEIRRLRFLCSITTGNKDTVNAKDDGEYPFYVRSPRIERINTYSFDGEAVLTAGDGVGAGKVFHYVNGKFDYHQRVYNLHYFKDVQGKYLYYYLKESFIKEIEKSNAKSTVDSIRLPMLLNFPIVLPSESVQTCIANYLDHKCSKIDETIEKQKQVIEKLQEYKQSIITEAVTKGLNPDVKMKDSGVEWIGEIPEHWEVQKLKYCTQCNKNTLNENTSSDLMIKYIDIGSVTNEDGIKEFQELKFKNAPSRARRIVNKNDTIISTVRTYLKAIAFISDKYDRYICSTGFAVFTPNIYFYGKYMFYCLHSECFISKVESISVGISYPAVNAGDIINLKILCPPINEQNKIADYLDRKCTAIDKSISQKEKLIEKLTEYKKSLIYECVTGKREI